MATLASAEESQNFDAYTGGESSKNFILHYNFPPFSVGETGRTGSTSRREIGHGALAERSIAGVLPPHNEFPYAIRVVSEVMESNGSTSMASVCAGVLSLLDAGVPLKRPVAGISRRPRHRVRGRRQDHETPHPPFRHHRQRGPLRRHGLQALRHVRRRHRFPARPQARGCFTHELLAAAIQDAKEKRMPGARSDERLRWTNRARN